jgi:hypothetical protein
LNKVGCGWRGHVAHMGEIKNAYKILVKNMKEKDLLEDLVINGKIKLK